MAQTSQTPPVVVRALTARDAPEVARLFAMLGYEWTVDVMAARIAAFLGGGERALVAASTGDNTGSLLGILTLHITPVLHRAGPVGRLTALVVDEVARGRGVGRALVQAAEADCASRGCVLVEVTSNVTLLDAHAFYERLGYVGTSRRFGKTLTPSA